MSEKSPPSSGAQKAYQLLLTEVGNEPGNLGQAVQDFVFCWLDPSLLDHRELAEVREVLQRMDRLQKARRKVAARTALS
jgi:hypothetical protein